MPSVSEKQRRFMGAELARKRSGEKTKTGMSETQLSEFAGSIKKHGSLNDLVFHEEADKHVGDTFMPDVKPHGVHSGYSKNGPKSNQDLDCGDAIKFGHIEWEELDVDGDPKIAGNSSALRDIGTGVHIGAPIMYFGPDTDYRAEEIDPYQYGRDWEPIPLRDYYKVEDKQFERGFRAREQDEYDQTRTPGAVTDSQSNVEAHNAVNYQGAGPNKDSGDKAGECDYRSFESQRSFARTNKDKSQEYAVDVSGHDTKEGEDIT